MASGCLAGAGGRHGWLVHEPFQEPAYGITGAAPILAMMGEQHELELGSTSEEETRQLGERIGRLLKRGDILLLSGDLGTGKTCLTQGIGRGLACEGQVNSPSFVLMNEYAGRETLYHVDLYRIEDVEELDDLGLWDYAEKGVLVIEWPERGAELLPGDGLVVELRAGALGPRSRNLRFIPRGPRGEELVASLGAA
jgi:tRNA threonylcarbamoyladenosine biosynthesis protein TsaE